MKGILLERTAGCQDGDEHNWREVEVVNRGFSGLEAASAKTCTGAY